MFGSVIASAKDFFLKEVSLKVFSLQVWMFFALGIMAVVVALVVISAVKNSTKKTVEAVEDTSADEKEEAVSDETIAKEEKEESPVEEVAEEEKEESPVEEVVEEEKEETPVEEVVEEVAEKDVKEESPAEEIVKEQPVEEAKEEVVEEQPIEEVAEEQPVEEVAEEEAAATAEDAVEEVAAEVISKAKGKFEICNSSIGGYRYHLLANNGQLLYRSKDYKTYEACYGAIEKFVNSVVNGSFSVRSDKFGNHKYTLKSATSNNIIYVGESYTTKKSCLNSVESVKRFAPTATIIDATEADFQVTTLPFEIPEEVKLAVEEKRGATGKWAIDHVDAEDEKSPYVFLLYANNGQLLYESREYKTWDNCRKGIDAFVYAVNDGYFIIDEDKFGRFRFFLRSNKVGSQAEYVGQNYTDKGACGHSIISVYKFALLTALNLD